MSADLPAVPAPVAVASLRSRWNRAFALLTIVLLLTGASSVIASRLLVDAFRDSAVRVEREARLGAQLRAEVISHSVLLASPVTAEQQRGTALAQAAIQTRFAEVIASQSPVRATRLLRQASARWQAMVAEAAPAGRPADLATRGAAVSIGGPAVLALLDSAGTASRATVRADLAAAARLEQGATAVLVALMLLAVGLAVRLARRLSSEVLRPVGVLRDSANHLAAGDLDHRVVVRRHDELGDLAVSFNAMADAIAGSQRGLRREANTDSLTGLANRSAFYARLESALSAQNRRSGTAGVLFVDLDDFKDVNDMLGHAAGDELLRVVAGRLIDAVRPGDLVARLGGDEFALLLDVVFHPAVAGTVAERVVTALRAPVDLGESRVHVGASVGLAMRQRDSTADSLMREADVAMYAAKGKGKNRVERYDATLDTSAVPRQLLRSPALRAHSEPAAE